MALKKYEEFIKESRNTVLDGPELSSDEKRLQQAKFTKGDKVEWSEGDYDYYTIDYAFVDMGTILYNLRNPQDISSGGRVREDELIAFESFENLVSESIEQKININGNIHREDIEGDVPSDAKYAHFNPSDKFIQKFYRIKNVKFNDNTNKDILEYYGEQGGWHPSSYNSKDIDKLSDINFREII